MCVCVIADARRRFGTRLDANRNDGVKLKLARVTSESIARIYADARPIGSLGEAKSDERDDERDDEYDDTRSR